MPLQKGRHDISTKHKRNSSIVLRPPVDAGVGIAPQQVAHETDVGDVARTLQVGNLAERLHLRAEAAVHAQDLLVDEGRHREAVEHVREHLPHLDGVPPLALVVEAVDAVDAGALVIAAKDEEVFGIHDFVGQQEADGLQGLLAPVDVVPQKQVVGLRGESAVLEQPEEVGVLAVDVAADLDGGLELEQHGLAEEDRPGPLAQVADLGLADRGQRPRRRPAQAEQPLRYGLDRRHVGAERRGVRRGRGVHQLGRQG